MEYRNVTVKLGGVTREITIERLTPKHTWSYAGPVVAKFPSGRKTHTRRYAQVFERDGQFRFGLTVVKNRHCTVVAFADVLPGNSGWTNNALPENNSGTGLDSSPKI